MRLSTLPPSNLHRIPMKHSARLLVEFLTSEEALLTSLSPARWTRKYKSSGQRPAAIVSPQAGTTRDVLESALDIAGYPVVISDTAGLRDSDDPIEQEGVRRALKRAEDADLKILITDSSLLTMNGLSHVTPSLPAVANQFLGLSEALVLSSGVGEGTTGIFKPGDTLVVLNKTDLLDSAAREIRELVQTRCEGAEVCAMSCKTREGVDTFMGQLGRMLKTMCGNPLAGSPSITQARHRHHLALCRESLTAFLDLTKDSSCLDSSLDLSAQELRLSIQQLGRVTGRVGVEEILDVVFKDFCIGK